MPAPFHEATRREFSNSAELAFPEGVRKQQRDRREITAWLAEMLATVKRVEEALQDLNVPNRNDILVSLRDYQVRLEHLLDRMAF